MFDKLRSYFAPPIDGGINPLSSFLLAFVSAISSELLFYNFVAPSSLLTSFCRVILLFVSFYTFHRFASVSLSNYRPNLKDLFTLTIITVVALFIVLISEIICHGIPGYLKEARYLLDLTPESLRYATPYATGGLILQAILGVHYGLVFGVSLAMILGIYLDATWLPLYVLTTTLVACLSFSSFRSRTAYIKAGLNVSIVAILFALGSTLLDPQVTFVDGVARILSALLGGAFCTFLAAGITPIFEYVGGYVTDMRLIEMATLDHPLLKELSIQAPGTWNHSMVMGMMVESAASEIGANPVLSRVSAYFHDVGKVTKPLYFVENQRPGENRHDKLSPSMSALIIRSHVKDGIELAREHKLPKPVEEMIPQHHGTSLIEYFYDKARKEAEEAGEDPELVDLTLYSYPGPKPQTKEAGIIMLADGIEAASRTLSEPTLDRLQGLVQKLINKVFSSGELDECELTLKDLHAIAKAFTRVLNGIYHQRIAYAESVEKGDEPTEQAASEHSGNGSTENKEEKPEEKEDLKRLGL